MKRPTAAIDVDGVILKCIDYAITLANKEHGFNPPISIEEVDGWLPCGTRVDVLLKYFEDPEFFRNQPVIEGAKEFIHKLSEIAEVIFVTATPLKFMGIRAERLAEEFPEVPAENIYLCSKKNKIDADFLLDDGAHNVLESSVTYPVLMRRPWNRHVTGVLAVNTFDDFLQIVKTAIRGYCEPKVKHDKPALVAIVGPSGSGKTLLKDNMISKFKNVHNPISSTTRKKRDNEPDNAYHFISTEEFLKAEKNGELLESTSYAGHHYGLLKTDMDSVLNSGHHVISVLDMCGAMAIKAKYPDAVIAYVKRNKDDRIMSILNRNTDNEDKKRRLVSMDREVRNEELCDCVINNCGDIAAAVNELAAVMQRASSITLG